MTTLRIRGNQNVDFIHIPKTAGTSISKWLRNVVGENYCEIHWDHPLQQNLHLSTNMQVLGINTTNNVVPFKFTSIRNPWSRTFSAYQNLVRHYEEKRTDALHATITELILMNKSFPSFNDFVSLLPNITSSVGPGWNLTTPQTAWVTDGVDCVLRTESLDQDFKIIQDMFDLKIPIGVHNPSIVRTNYRFCYTDNSIKIVAKCFESDIDTWKYIF